MVVLCGQMFDEARVLKRWQLARGLHEPHATCVAARGLRRVREGEGQLRGVRRRLVVELGYLAVVLVVVLRAVRLARRHERFVFAAASLHPVRLSGALVFPRRAGRLPAVRVRGEPRDDVGRGNGVRRRRERAALADARRRGRSICCGTRARQGASRSRQSVARAEKLTKPFALSSTTNKPRRGIVSGRDLSTCSARLPLIGSKSRGGLHLDLVPVVHIAIRVAWCPTGTPQKASDRNHSSFYRQGYKQSFLLARPQPSQRASLAPTYCFYRTSNGVQVTARF